MENPILEFRKEKGWSRPEFQRRSGLSYQTLRNLEIGESKKLSSATLECLSFVGIGLEIQELLDVWREYQQIARRNQVNDCKVPSPRNEAAVQE